MISKNELFSKKCLLKIILGMGIIIKNIYKINQVQISLILQENIYKKTLIKFFY